MNILSVLKIGFVVLLTSFLVASCEQEDTNQELNLEKIAVDYLYYEGDATFSYYLNSELVPIESSTYMKESEIASGDYTVFEYQFTHDDDPLIADDEYTETISFQIPSDITSFSYNTSQLEALDLVLTKYCYCLFDDREYIAPTGTIKGTKVGTNLWYIEMDVVFYGENTRTLSDFFELSSLD